MNTSRTVSIGMVVAIVVGGCGTQTNSSPVGGSATTGGGSGTGDSAGSAAPPVDDTVALATALSAAKAVAGTVAAIAPLKDLRAIFEGGQDLPACPMLSVDGVGAKFPVSLDYGTSCKPAAFRTVSFSGRASGEFFASYSAYNMTLDAVTAAGDALSGTIGGSLTVVSRDAAEFRGSIDVRGREGVTVRGGFTAVVDASKGSTTITDASLSISEAPSVVRTVKLTGAVVEASAAGQLEPRGGTATVAGGEGETQVTRTVSLAVSTPANTSKSR